LVAITPGAGSSRIAGVIGARRASATGVSLKPRFAMTTRWMCGRAHGRAPGALLTAYRTKLITGDSDADAGLDRLLHGGRCDAQAADRCRNIPLLRRGTWLLVVINAIIVCGRNNEEILGMDLSQTPSGRTHGRREAVRSSGGRAATGSRPPARRFTSSSTASTRSLMNTGARVYAKRRAGSRVREVYSHLTTIPGRVSFRAATASGCDEASSGLCRRAPAYGADLGGRNGLGAASDAEADDSVVGRRQAEP